MIGSQNGFDNSGEARKVKWTEVCIGADGTGGRVPMSCETAVLGAWGFAGPIMVFQPRLGEARVGHCDWKRTSLIWTSATPSVSHAEQVSSQDPQAVTTFEHWPTRAADWLGNFDTEKFSYNDFNETAYAHSVEVRGYSRRCQPSPCSYHVHASTLLETVLHAGCDLIIIATAVSGLEPCDGKLSQWRILPLGFPPMAHSAARTA